MTGRKGVESYSSLLKALLFTAIPIVFSTAIYNINQIIDLTIFNHIMSSQGYVEQEYMALQGIYTGKYDTLINVPMAIANALGASVVPELTPRSPMERSSRSTIRSTKRCVSPCSSRSRAA